MSSRDPGYDPRRWSAHVAKAITPRYAFNATDAKTARQWQRTLRGRFIERLGGFPETKTPLRARTLKTEEYSDHIRQEISFESRKGLPVFAYFLSPRERARTPLPTLLCLHGHGYGVDALVGLDAFGKPLRKEEYHHAFALQAVRHGYAVLAPEILGFGRRRDNVESITPGSRENSCLRLSGAALMMGETMAGWRTYDAIRAIDYLETRREVDAEGIGIMGISGGGLNALFLAAVDERVKATMVSGYLNTFRNSVMAIPHCIDNFVPGLVLDAEMSDIAGLVAPRALWCENGEQDTIFPVAAFRRALRDVKRVYKVLGATEKCAGEIFEGDHQFYGHGAWPFLEKHL